MNLAVLWSPTAKAELEEIARYVARTSPVYAERLVDRILAHADQAAIFPEAGRMVPEGRRKDVREVFEGSYRIIYLVQTSRIDVLAVVHSRQQLTWPGESEPSG
jgi:toxin ParE1/3/4